MRATAEFHGPHVDELPPVKVIIGTSNASEDVAIKVSDQGGGIARKHIPHLYNYLFTTAPPEVQDQMMDADMHSFGRSSPLAGLGYGLGVARAYARYFGGDLKLMSVEGHGTDAFVHLNRFGNASSIWHEYGSMARGIYE